MLVGGNGTEDTTSAFSGGIFLLFEDETNWTE